MSKYLVATVPNEDGESEPFFSWEDCGGCGTWLSGDRYKAVAIPQS